MMKVLSQWMYCGQLALLLLFCQCLASPTQYCESDVIELVAQNVSEEFSFAQAKFGERNSYGSLQGSVVHAIPRNGCSVIESSTVCSANCFVLIEDGDCSYGLKAHEAEQAGYNVAIISNTVNDELLTLEAGKDGKGVSIPVIYVGKSAGRELEKYGHSARDPVTICFCPQYWDFEFYIIPFAIIVGICFVLMAMFMISRYYRHFLEQRRNRISPTNLRKIPTKKFKKGDEYYDVCAICLDEYKDGDRLRILPCEHVYHCKCVDPWLTEGKKTCPVCKRPVETSRRNRNRRERGNLESGAVENESGPDETTPLITSATNTSTSNAVVA